MTIEDNTPALAKGLLKVPTLINLLPGPSPSPPQDLEFHSDRGHPSPGLSSTTDSSTHRPFRPNFSIGPKGAQLRLVTDVSGFKN